MNRRNFLSILGLGAAASVVPFSGIWEEPSGVVRDPPPNADFPITRDYTTGIIKESVGLEGGTKVYKRYMILNDEYKMKHHER